MVSCAMAHLKGFVIYLQVLTALVGPDPEKKKLQRELQALKEEYDQCKHRLDLLTANNAVSLFLFFSGSHLPNLLEVF